MNQTATLTEPSWEECMELLDGLPGVALERRPQVIERLLRNPSPGIRERALRIGATVLADETLVDYLRREGDAVLRNGALEILKERGGRSFSLAVGLLRDDEPLVVMQAVQILDHVKDPRAVEPLRAVLHHDDVNVAQAAIVAIGHLGDARSIPDLLPFLKGDPWLQMAAIQALGDLRSAAAVPALSRLLTDLAVGLLAAEALAQIGGVRALRALARHWLSFHEELDPETYLGLLAHVLEGLTRRPPEMEGLRPALSDRLRDPFRGVRMCAARCLLALGRGPEDGEALHILAADDQDPAVLPSCLARRRDLIDPLLGKPGLLRDWGFRLLARHPRQGSARAVVAALGADDAVEWLEAIVQALVKVRRKGLAAPILDLYLRLELHDRVRLEPVLARHRATLARQLDERRDLSADDRLVLSAILGGGARAVRAGILELDAERRVEVLTQLADRAAVVRGLPWGDWLAAEPEIYTEAAAEVAMRSGLRELLPDLRDRLADEPTRGVLRAIGELRDAEAVPRLVELLDRGAPRLRPMVAEALGKIGGPTARRALREMAGTDDLRLARVAYRALAACATEQDESFFRAAAAHSDWYVRLAAAEALGRFARAGNLETLSQLAADPVALVAQQALTHLEH